MTDDERKRICEYFDNLCSAMIPRRVPPAEIHPCRKLFSEVEDTEKDLCQLLNRVQRHTKCGSHCQRRKKGSRQYVCRFGFPKPLCETSRLIKENGAWKMEVKRNDSLMSRYNPQIASVWRANTDFTPVISKEAVLNYIAKYASKAEKPSESYYNLLKKLLQKHLLIHLQKL